MMQEFIPKEVIIDQVRAGLDAELAKIPKIIKVKDKKKVKNIEWPPDGLIIVFETAVHAANNNNKE